MSQLEGFPEIPPSEPIRLPPSLRAIKGGALAPAQRPLMTQAQIRAVDYAASRELAESSEADLGFAPALWAQVALPYKEPARTEQVWKKAQGAVSMVMTPGYMSTDASGAEYLAFPFGIIPRQLLIFMTTRAQKTQSPTIDLGSSMSEFMRNLGMNRNGGRDAARLTEQVNRLFGSNLEIKGLKSFEDGSRNEETEKLAFVKRHSLWFKSDNTLAGLTPDEPGAKRRDRGSVTLSDEYFQTVNNQPVPIDLGAIRALGNRPVSVDLYLWATWRVFNLKSQQKISWAALKGQFGSEYALLRQFRADFIKNMDLVKSVYPDLRFEFTDTGLTLFKSKTHISPQAARRALTAGPDASDI